MEELKWQETIPAAKKYDLIVCGGWEDWRPPAW